MASAKISSKSQIVIPADVRRRLGLRRGDRLSIHVEGDSMILRKESDSCLEQLDELAGPAWEGLEREVARARREWDR